MARRDIAGLAALGALGMMLAGKGRAKGDLAPVEDRGTAVQAFADDQYNPDVTAVDRNENYGNEGRRMGPVAIGRAAATAPARVAPNPTPMGRSYGAGDAQRMREYAYQQAQARAASPEGRAERAAMEQSQALENVYPESNFIGPGLKTVAGLAKGLANRAPRIAEYTQPVLGAAERKLLGAPPKQLTGPSKAELVARDRAARAAARQEKMVGENAERYGLDPEAPGYEAAARAVRERLGDGAFTVKKRGGAVKAKKMASGGATKSSASSRGDGIAKRGKTRGKLY